MKKWLFLILTIPAILFYINKNQEKHLINPIIGDISYIEKFNVNPNEKVDETTRIKAHLEYAEQLLRKKEVTHLSEAEKHNRKKSLDLLKEYCAGEIFPTNAKYKNERRPCFLDNEGRICAVGYLVQQTAGMDLVHSINNAFQYDKIFDMNHPGLQDWVAKSGFSLKEIATIQPTYGWNPPNNEDFVPRDKLVVSGVLSGANVGISAIQMKQGSHPNTSTFWNWAGMVTGSGQIVAGLVPGRRLYERSNQENRLDFFNIGLGTATLLYSTWGLVEKKRKKKNTNAAAWKVSTFVDTRQGNTGGGVTLRKKF